MKDDVKPAALPVTRLSRAVAPTTGLEFVSGEGVELVTADGARYLDFISGYGVVNTGHCHPRVVAAIREQVVAVVRAALVPTHAEADRFVAAMQRAE